METPHISTVLLEENNCLISHKFLCIPRYILILNGCNTLHNTRQNLTKEFLARKYKQILYTYPVSWFLRVIFFWWGKNGFKKFLPNIGGKIKRKRRWYKCDYISGHPTGTHCIKYIHIYIMWRPVIWFSSRWRTETRRKLVPFETVKEGWCAVKRDKTPGGAFAGPVLLCI